MTHFTAVIGLQWGDEGKGKVVDHLAGRFDWVVRFQGGANAGHTVRIGDREHIFHLLPSGLLRKGKRGAIGAGVVLDPEVLLEEIAQVEALSEPLQGRLFIDYRTALVLPFHKFEDTWEESLKGGVGSTRRGIGPAYRDRYARIALRVGDLEHENWLAERLRESLDFNNEILAARYGKPPLDLKEIYLSLQRFAQAVRPYLADVPVLLQEAGRKGERVLLEGAQGTFLDIFYGTYPYVTSSHTVAGGAAIGAGIPPHQIREVIGVSKAYTTRVGRGPFPTELKDEMGQYLRKQGGEFGATTGRPRRCGWLDLPLLRYAALLNGATGIVITKLDVLSGLDRVKVAVAYELDGQRLEHPPAQTPLLYHVRPIYEEFLGWDPFPPPRRFEDLPQAAQTYLRFIEEALGVPVIGVSYGKEREELIWLQ